MPMFKFSRLVALISFIGTATVGNAQEVEMEFFLYGYGFAQEEGESFQRTKSLKTGDHHCDRDCKGEPTRTGYRIEMRPENKNEKFTGASVACESALCGFSQTHYVRHSATLASTAFDVWSRPMLWTLTATVTPFEIVRGDQTQLDNDRVKAGTVFQVEHNKREYLDVDMDVRLPGIGTIRVNPSDPPAPFFKLLSTSEVGFVATYSILYSGAELD